MSPLFCFVWCVMTQITLFAQTTQCINITNHDSFNNSSDFVNFTNFTNYPTVLMHGVLADKDNLDEFKTMLEQHYGIKVFNLELGDGPLYSLYTPMEIQLTDLCKKIYSKDELKNGFNFIGMSQGGLLARGYVEYCNKYPVHNLITLVAPNAGVYYKNNFFYDIYEPSNQMELSFADYWRDPFRYELYLSNSTYLADLNDENFNYKNRLDVVDNFVMIWSVNDDVINPPQSAKFSMYFVEDNNLVLYELTDTKLYQNDFLGLKTMNDENRLHFHETDCLHSEHKEPECFHQLVHVLQKFLV